MKKRMLALLLTVLMVTALLTGCGGASNESAAMDYAVMEEAQEAPGAVMGSGASSLSSDQTATEQKLIKRVTISAETEDLEALLPQVLNKVAELGGYVESQELYNGSTYSSYRSRSVDMTVRIPADRLSAFTEQVEGLSNVVNYSETTDDVTLQYVDTEARVKALEVEQERLLELLAKADNMTDLLEIEERLTDVRYELESYASQLRTLDNKVNYATVYLYIDQVKVYTEVEPQTVWQRIASGFSGNLEDIGENLTDFFVWAVTYSPQLIFWAAVIALVVLLLKRRFRRTPVTKAPVRKPEDEKKQDS